MIPTVDLHSLPFAAGGHLLLKRALAGLPEGDQVQVVGDDPALQTHVRAWCRGQGHTWIAGPAGGGVVLVGGAARGRWQGAEVAGGACPDETNAIAAHAPPSWGLAARGSTVEAGGPQFHFRFTDRNSLWTGEAPRHYARAAAAQWDPATAVDWSQPQLHSRDVEVAVVQVMTYLVENELAALAVPAKFVAQIHPHFREVIQTLAVQAADEARHVEVFSRRIVLYGHQPGLSTVGGQSSLKTLLDEPDFGLATFLLSILGEGSFLSLLWFLAERSPDEVTQRICTLAAQDEARHVAFGLSHLSQSASVDATLLSRLAAAVERRHDALQHTAGLNEEVFDALVVVAAGAFTPQAVGSGFEAVQSLVAHMHEGRVARLLRLGFPLADAEALSSLHTRNFM